MKIAIRILTAPVALVFLVMAALAWGTTIVLEKIYEAWS